MQTSQSQTGGERFFIRVRGRVLGPFDIAKLKSLRTRGQFSRVHEVSTDRLNWAPASTIDALLVPSGATAHSAAHAQAAVAVPNGADAVASPTSGPAVSAGTPPAQQPAELPVWYYRYGDSQFGPTTASEIRSLLKSGRLDKLDIVWKEGLPSWVPVRDFPELMLPATEAERSLAENVRNRSRRRRRAGLAGVIAFGCALLAVAAVYFGVARNIRAKLPSIEDVSSIMDSGAIANIDGSAAEQNLGQCVGLLAAGVRATLKDGTLLELPYETGTCFVIDKEGHALTNKHVIEAAQKRTRADVLRAEVLTEKGIKLEPRIWTFFESKAFTAEVVETAEGEDVAILKIDHRFKHFLRLSSSDKLARGTKVIALGYPGIDRSPLSPDEFFETLKKLSADHEHVRTSFKERDLRYSRTDGIAGKVAPEQNGRMWIQHTATINPGNSGGPLLTADGVVWGINTLKLSSEKDRDSSLFYAISIAQLRSEIDDWVNTAEWE